MESTVREVQSPDGRRLAVQVAGADDGEFVLFQAGTPGDDSLFPPDVEAAERRGLTCVSYARPGYGDSERRPDRRVADCAGDVSAIADALGIESFFTIGWSFGGPHALACAALLSERVRAVATISSTAPRRAEGLDWLAGMGEENLAELGAAEAGEEKLRDFLTEVAEGFRSTTAGSLADQFGDLVCDADREALADPEFAESSAEVMRKVARAGIWGWFDDDMASMRDWGFDLTGIEVPVGIWQGGEDRFVPSSHGKWLAETVPSATLHLRPDDGHMSLTHNHFDEILDRLLSEDPDAARR